MCSQMATSIDDGIAEEEEIQISEKKDNEEEEIQINEKKDNEEEEKQEITSNQPTYNLEISKDNVYDEGKK